LLPGQVIWIEPHGHEVHLVIQVGSSRWVVRATETALRAGERCWLELDRDSIYWFDATGQRLRTALAAPEAETLPTPALEEGTRGLKTQREERKPEPGRERESEL